MSTDELLQLRAEEEVAREMGLRWQERGPRPDMLPEGQTTWMGGHQYRPNSGTWANRGGSNKQWYTEFYRAKNRPRHPRLLPGTEHPSEEVVRLVASLQMFAGTRLRPFVVVHLDHVHACKHYHVHDHLA